MKKSIRPIVSDAGPLHYLVLIRAIDVLPKLFGHVLVPEAVTFELSRPATPSAVRAWLDAAPVWLERRQVPGVPDPSTGLRGAGERAAIALARSVDVPLLLIDDRAGEAMARSHGLETSGTLGVLVRAAQLGLVDLSAALTQLRATNFRCRPELLDAILVRRGGAT